jgi:thermitase
MISKIRNFCRVNSSIVFCSIIVSIISLTITINTLIGNNNSTYYENLLRINKEKVFKDKYGNEVVIQWNEKTGIPIEVPWGSPVDILELIRIYSENPITEYSVPNFGLEIRPQKTPNDNHYGSQWALPKISAPPAWDITTGNNDIVIAIIDEGVDLSHEDLNNKLVPGIDVTDQGDNSPQPYSWDGHGTACAGIAAAETNNNQGIAGVDWSCKIMPVQIARNKEGDPNWTYSDWIVSGIDWAVNNEADVLSNS